VKQAAPRRLMQRSAIASALPDRVTMICAADQADDEEPAQMLTCHVDRLGWPNPRSDAGRSIAVGARVAVGAHASPPRSKSERS
jgi:hypothetical protein